MRSIICLLLFTQALFISAQDSLAQKVKWYKHPVFTISTPSALTIGYGLCVFGKHELLTSSYKVREYRNTHYANFHTHADDYLVFGAPAAAITLNLCGVKTKNNLKASKNKPAKHN